MRELNRDIPRFITEINLLWQPVYPYLARHISVIYGRRDGTIIEMGPFCGVIFELARQGIGKIFRIASFPETMTDIYKKEIRDRQISGVPVIGTDAMLSGVEDSSADLVIFRGALFFPDFFTVDYPAILRVLTPHGKAFIGGGFGKYTPPEVIAPIAKRSRELNLLIGKKEITTKAVTNDLCRAGVTTAGISTDGGLWITLKKPAL
ncbi:MAG: class I SAM-dependent methyltransferase [Syntrophorhabdaceae bacterium]